jgi:hypothetical protein
VIDNSCFYDASCEPLEQKAASKKEEDTLQTNTNSHPLQTYELTHLPRLTPLIGVRCVGVHTVFAGLALPSVNDVV